MLPRFVFDQDFPIEETNGKELSIGGPVTRDSLSRNLLLVHVLLVRSPDSKVGRGTGSEILQHWVESEALNLVIVLVS